VFEVKSLYTMYEKTRSKTMLATRLNMRNLSLSFVLSLMTEIPIEFDTMAMSASIQTRMCMPFKFMYNTQIKKKCVYCKEWRRFVAITTP